MARRLRLKKLISWTIQGPIVLRLLIHFMAYNAATLFLLMTVCGIRSTMLSIAEQSPTLVQPSFWQQASPVMISMLVMTPFMVWDLMKLTNRIAGPLYRFETHLKDFVQSGVLKPAALRDGDLLTNFQLQFNEFVEALHALHPETRPVPELSADSPAEPNAGGVAAAAADPVIPSHRTA